MAKPTYSSEILGKLRESIPAPSVAQPVIPAPEPVGPGRAMKVSVSLYPRDMAALDDIKLFMAGCGFRNLSDSEALRLACRQVKLAASLISDYQEMLREDGRRKEVK